MIPFVVAWLIVCAQGNRWEEQVRGRLRATLAVMDEHATASRVLKIGTLNGEEWDTVSVQLTAGVRYSILGACDDDCARLQLRLATSTNSELAIDRNSENAPVLHFTPRLTAPHRIRVVMETCRKNPCWYGIGLVASRD
jgi:hypothetical protein